MEPGVATVERRTAPARFQPNIAYLKSLLGILKIAQAVWIAVRLLDANLGM